MEPGKDSPSEEDYSLMILKNRLAKGEITVKEFDELKKKLSETSDTQEIKDEIRNVSETMEKIQEKQSKSASLQRKMKSETTILLLAIILGLVGLQGIGHIYVGKVGKGIGILIGSIILFYISIALIITLVGSIIGIPMLIGFVVMFFWQIIDARKLCREYNDELEAIGETPW